MAVNALRKISRKSNLFETAFSHVSRFTSCKFPLDFRMRRSIGRLSARLRSARFTEVARSLEEIDAENDR